MLSGSLSEPSAAAPRRVMMTVDAVGGVWRYAVDAARGLNARGISVVLVGLGPAPTAGQRGEAEALADTRLVWLDQPLDWMVQTETALDRLGDALSALARDHAADVVHLNVPSQAAGLSVDVPIVAVSHSCVATWWRAVRGGDLPRGWAWQKARTGAGLHAADAVLAPSRSHADAVEAVYGPVPTLTVVPNAVVPVPGAAPAERDPVVFAAGRWWDEGKNGRTLDAAAAMTRWPVHMAGSLDGPNGEDIALAHAVALGEQPGAAVRAAVRRAAVVASPSLYEPFGLSVLEAALEGAALVLSDIQTYREIWDGAALFATRDDPAAFAVALNRLADDPALRALLGARARSIALRYLPDRQADTLAALYGGLAARRSAPPTPASKAHPADAPSVNDRLALAAE
ncbi:glycosyltransferase family 4 protein [Mongoliimonas terrestris]|uniref:glycosyltransferase family 4 protein n=1 Tax=Mongoliimonas terrestris TaxID=1709001 RepID=UPI000949AC4B|nr:glycosyltransferase family 4 protein [Mongoliimonas terrestris]